MTTPRYLLAKYIPDLMRAEPRNIGVILWTPQTVVSRFVAEKLEERGDVDGRSVPDFVNSTNAYKQWIQYWYAQLQKPELEPVNGGKPVSRTSPEYLEVLKTSNNGNFILMDGGFLLDEISMSQVTEAVEFLFKTLVRTAPERDLDDESGEEQGQIQEICLGLLKRSGLYTRKELKRPATIECTIPNSNRTERFKFSYGLELKNSRCLYHRVGLLNQEGEVLKLVYSSNWMFQRAIATGVTTPGESGVIVYVGDDKVNEPKVKQAIESLQGVTRVFNLFREEGKLLEEFERVSLML